MLSGKKSTRHRVQGTSIGICLVTIFHNYISGALNLVPCALNLQAFQYFCCMKILMVCLGNICRSPLAEGILQHKAFKAGFKWSVESAGTESYHVGEAPHHLSQKVAKCYGVDISKQRARRFNAEDFKVYDKIYALSKDVVENMKAIARNKFDASKVDLLMNELHPGKNMDVPDPWYGPEPGYHEAYKLIEAACDAIVRKYGMKKTMQSGQ